jgi:anti-sigma regulatory factor (Ser/Thr protein kinase)
MRDCRTFSPEVGSIRAARQFVLGAAGQVARDTGDAISVMVSELAMNAVQYAATNFDVIVELSAGQLRVEVTDAGGGQPEAGPLPPLSMPHGRGLVLVGKLADSWGVMPAAKPPGKCVWFIIAVGEEFG